MRRQLLLATPRYTFPEHLVERGKGERKNKNQISLLISAAITLRLCHWDISRSSGLEV